MNRKFIFFICIFFFVCISCNAKELKGYGNPKIGKIVQISKVNLLTKYMDDMIYPKYEIELKVKESFTIIALELQTNYIFGQNLNLISSKDISLNLKDLEILNNNKKCLITIELEPVKKEIFKKEASIGSLNEERISNGFIYIKYKKSIKKTEVLLPQALVQRAFPKEIIIEKILSLPRQTSVCQA